MFVAAATGYAGIYTSQPADGERYAGGIYSNSSVNALGSSNQNSGLFRSSAPSPGNRPGNGGGIGQEEVGDAPLGDGLLVLVVCSVLLVVVKIIVRKFRR